MVVNVNIINVNIINVKGIGQNIAGRVKMYIGSENKLKKEGVHLN